MGKKTQKNISDEDLAVILKDRLNSDPVYYTDFIKKFIDAIPCRLISPKVFFEILTPDKLFYPEFRRRLKKWQLVYSKGRNSRNDYQKTKAKEARWNLEQVGKSLAAIGQGRPKSISNDTELNLRHDFTLVDQTCKKIYKRSKVSLTNRTLSIKEKFP